MAKDNKQTEAAKDSKQAETVKPNAQPANVAQPQNVQPARTHETAEKDQPPRQPKPVPKMSELVIKEIMIQKRVTREQAIHILQNPTKK